MPAGTGVSGAITDALSDQPLVGATIRLDGIGQTTSAADGTFRFDASDPQQLRPVVITSPTTVERSTRLRVPGPFARMPLMPVSLDLRYFDEMFRGNGGALHRWTTAPTITIQTRVLQFTSINDTLYSATAAQMTSADVDGLVADLTWALPQLTGGNLSSFGSQARESAVEGERVNVSRPGIVIARYEGLQAATGFWGYTRWAWNGTGEMQTAIMMLDRGFEGSSSPFQRSLRAHELGHALGYSHVTSQISVMNSNARTEPTPLDRDGARFAFLRPPLNRSPDTDPEPLSGNLRTGTALFWAGDR